MIYKFREGYSLPVKAQVVGDRIAVLQKEKGERPGAHDVVEDARPEDSPLHPCFEWDDSEAAEKWRMAQARRLLASFEEVVIDERGIEHRHPACVSVSVGREPSAYMNTRMAMSQPDTSAIVIAEAKAALAGWSRRYRHLVKIAKEFGPVLEAIDALDEQKPKNGKADQKSGNGKRRRQPAERSPAQGVAC